MGLRVGAAETIITPPGGVDLSGYAARSGPSSGVHDDLHCRAVVLEGGEDRLALVALDVIGLEVSFDQELRWAVERATGIAAERVLVNCSHTHAGPAISGLPGLGEASAEYVTSLQTRVVETVQAALGKLSEAAAWYGEASVRVGINRRARGESGISIGRNPEGLVDDRVRVLALEQATGRPVATLFQHACHGTTVGGDNTLVSAEWMGAACAALRARGVGVPVFLQGCAGHTNPEREEPTFAQMTHLGARMAEAVVQARAAATPLPAVPLRGLSRRLELQLQPPPQAEAARAHVAQAETNAAQAREGGEAYLARAYESLAATTQRVFGLSGPAPETHALALHGVRVGDLALLGISGEAFLEYAQWIAQASPFPRTWVLGYTGGCACYVPTAVGLAEGGYEAQDSFLWYGTRPFVPETERFVVQQAGQILNALWRQA